MFPKVIVCPTTWTSRPCKEANSGLATSNPWNVETVRKTGARRQKMIARTLRQWYKAFSIQENYIKWQYWQYWQYWLRIHSVLTKSSKVMTWHELPLPSQYRSLWSARRMLMRRWVATLGQAPLHSLCATNSKVKAERSRHNAANTSIRHTHSPKDPNIGRKVYNGI